MFWYSKLFLQKGIDSRSIVGYYVIARKENQDMKNLTAAEKRIIRKARNEDPGYRERFIIEHCTRVETFSTGNGHKVYTLYMPDSKGTTETSCDYDMTANTFIG